MRRGWLTGGLFGVILVLGGGGVSAQPEPGGPAPVEPQVQVGGRAGPYQVPAPNCGGVGDIVDGVLGGVVGGVVDQVDDTLGNPLATPDIVCSAIEPERATVRMTWSVTAFVGAAAVDFVDFLYGFDVGAVVSSPVREVSSRLQHRIVARLAVASVGVGGTLVWAGWLWLGRGLAGKALGEVALMVLLMGVTAAFLADPDAYFRGTSQVGRELSGEALGLASVDGRGGVSSGLEDALLRKPWEIVSFGRPLEGACVAAGDVVLAGADDPGGVMRSAGCESEARFVDDARGESLGAAVASFFLTQVIVVAVLVLGFGFVVGQVVLGALFAVAPLAVAFAPFPGVRRLAVGWLGSVARVLVNMVASAGVLAFTLTVVSGLMSVPGVPWSVNFMMAGGSVVGLLFARGRIMSAARGASDRAGSAVSRTQVGVGAVVAPAAGGVVLRERAVRGAAATARTGSPAAGAAAAALPRAVERVTGQPNPKPKPSGPRNVPTSRPAPGGRL